jgi:hypothetical protein
MMSNNEAPAISLQETEVIVVNAKTIFHFRTALIPARGQAA